MTRARRIDLAIATGTEAFLEAWYGPPPNPIVDFPADAPDPLRQWWSWEQAWGRKLTNQNEMLSRGELFEDQGHTVVYVENQAVMFWGYVGAGDPAVSERSTDATSPWVSLNVSLSHFLNQVAVFEASFGPHVVSGYLDRAQLGSVTESLTELPALVWPGVRMYAGEALLVNTWEGDPADMSESASQMTLIAAPSSAGLAIIDGTLSITWDYDSRTAG